MALPTYRDIVELMKKGATVEAQEQIMELREGALALQEENFQFRDRIRELEAKLKTKGQIEWDGVAYYLTLSRMKKKVLSVSVATTLNPSWRDYKFGIVQLMPAFHAR